LKNLAQRQEAQDGSACCTKCFDRVGIAGGIGTGDRNARDSEGNSGTETDAMEVDDFCWKMRLFGGGWPAMSSL
jgi:hypothetical protein